MVGVLQEAWGRRLFSGPSYGPQPASPQACKAGEGLHLLEGAAQRAREFNPNRVQPFWL